MARGPGGSLLVPVVLAFVVGILLYFYWGVSSQLGNLQADNRELKKGLAAARNERDNLHYRLNLLREDLDVALQKKDDLEQRAQEEDARREAAEDKAAQAEQKLKVSVQDRQQLTLEIKEFKEHNSILDDDIDQYRKDLWVVSVCEKENSQLKSVQQSTETLQEQNSVLQSSVQNLQQDKLQLTTQVGDLNRHVAGLKEQVKACGGLGQTKDTLEERVWKDLEMERGGRQGAVGQTAGDHAPALDLIKES